MFSSNEFSMKLRDRQKRISTDIKQEDTKAGISLTNASSTTVDVLNTWIRDSIKQEDTKNDSSSPQQNGKVTGLFIMNLF